MHKRIQQVNTDVEKLHCPPSTPSNLDVSTRCRSLQHINAKKYKTFHFVLCLMNDKQPNIFQIFVYLLCSQTLWKEKSNGNEYIVIV